MKNIPFPRIALLIAAILIAGLLFTGKPARANPGSIFLPLISAPPTNTVSNCPIFPADNIWNTRVDRAPVDPKSSSYISSMSPSTTLHADFGSGTWEGAPIGIPYVVVPGSTPLKPISFDYAGESDPGPYPIPANPPIEGGSTSTGDRHILILEKDNCILYELFAAYPVSGGATWKAGSGAVYHLQSNALRPAGWTSADAAGLPILAGLMRYDEFATGTIRHALRITADQTRKQYTWPARHFASKITDENFPSMGQRFRLKASFSVQGLSPQEQVIVTALKTYGVILADNGSNWYVSGAPDKHWNNDLLHNLFLKIHGYDFEAVDVSKMQVSPNSGQAR